MRLVAAASWQRGTEDGRAQVMALVDTCTKSTSQPLGRWRYAKTISADRKHQNTRSRTNPKGWNSTLT